MNRFVLSTTHERDETIDNASSVRGRAAEDDHDHGHDKNVYATDDMPNDVIRDVWVPIPCNEALGVCARCEEIAPWKSSNIARWMRPSK